jgi:hypothetical protein
VLLRRRLIGSFHRAVTRGHAQLGKSIGVGEIKMKAILINPDAKSVTRIEISTDARLDDYFDKKP